MFFSFLSGNKYVIWDPELKNALVETYNENFKATGERKIQGESFWENVLPAFKKKVEDRDINVTIKSLQSTLARLKAKKWPGTEEFSNFGKNLFLNFQCVLLSSVYFFLIRQYKT